LSFPTVSLSRRLVDLPGGSRPNEATRWANQKETATGRLIGPALPPRPGPGRVTMIIYRAV
jgi:hypothetical protein